jgi:hypothetical protein
MRHTPPAHAAYSNPDNVGVLRYTLIWNAHCLADCCAHLLLKVGVGAEVPDLQQQAAVFWLNSLNQEVDEPVQPPASQCHQCLDEAALQCAVEALNALVALLAIVRVVPQRHHPCTCRGRQTGVQQLHHTLCQQEP